MKKLILLICALMAIGCQPNKISKSEYQIIDTIDMKFHRIWLDQIEVIIQLRGDSSYRIAHMNEWGDVLRISPLPLTFEFLDKQ